MSLLHVLGFSLRVGHLLWTLCGWVIIYLISMNWSLSNKTSLVMDTKPGLFFFFFSLRDTPKISDLLKSHLVAGFYGKCITGSRETWRRRVLWGWVVASILVSVWIFVYTSSHATEKRKETLTSMCDERARMLQDQFNVSMNHVQAMSILISTFHHGKNPSAIDQATFARYTERTAFERPLTSGVAYAVRVLHSEREQFERQQGWTIKMMDTLEKNHNDDFTPEPSPFQEEYAPVIFAQETVSHVVSLDMLSGKEDCENVLRARASGKGVLTAPFPLLKTNRLGVILTFAVYKTDLPSNATPNERIQATDGYLGGIFDIESLVEKLLQQLASKQTILVNVYDTTNLSAPMLMYGSNVSDSGMQHVSGLNFGDPFRSHEMRCRFKHKSPWPWLAIAGSIVCLVIATLVGYIFHATVSHIARVEDSYHEMSKLKKRAEAADDAKSQFLATVSHEIRTPMNGVLGMMHMLMDTDLDVTQQDFIRTAQASGKALVSIINEVLDQAKIESGKLELEAVPFDLPAILDDVLSLFSGKSQEKGVELAVFISDQVPEMLIGDPVRFRQIITNLMGNSIKFTEKGHIFVTIHLVEEVIDSIDVETETPSSSSSSNNGNNNTLSGFPVADRRESWREFKAFSEEGQRGHFSSSSDHVNLIVSVEDTGVGIPPEARPRVFTPFMQVGPSISRTHGGTGIGLSISKCLVNMMNGEIGFASVPGVGSTFTFTAALGRSGSPRHAAGGARTEFRGRSALVVDPRPIRRSVSAYHIRRLGIRVELAPDAGRLGPGQAEPDMVFVERDAWDAEADALGHLGSKLFVLCGAPGDAPPAGPTAITKPLRASMVAASLQRAMGVGSRAAGPGPGPSLRNLLRGRRMLVVDDNGVNLMVAAGALKRYGAEVLCVASGFKALELMHPPHDFDACFMDIQMPGMDGFETTRRIREMEREFNNRDRNEEVNALTWRVPILAMTADVMQATQEQCSKYGMDGYVSKPFEAEQLYREVSRFFNNNSNNS